MQRKKMFIEKRKKIRLNGYLRKMAGILSVSVLCIFTGLAGYVCAIDIDKEYGDDAEEKVLLLGVTASAAEAVSAETAYDSTKRLVKVSSGSTVRDTNVGYICITVGAFEDDFGNYIYSFQYIDEDDEEAMSKYYVE